MDRILVIDKPSGMTSHDVVDVVRKKLNIRKVGHCGTLDPMATGVLVILTNKATKRQAELSSDEKEYVCTMVLGSATDSHDSTGKTTHEASTDNINDALIHEALNSFKGKQKQIPPMVSAKHYKGKRLYKLAREGIVVEREPVDIEIRKLEILKIDKDEVRFRVVCSKGTYIRTLCDDIGKRLGCFAHMKALRRTRSGNFLIDDAIKLESIESSIEDEDSKA